MHNKAHINIEIKTMEEQGVVYCQGIFWKVACIVCGRYFNYSYLCTFNTEGSQKEINTGVDRRAVVLKVMRLQEGSDKATTVRL